MMQTDSPSKTAQMMRLPDSRTLGFAEYGSAEGNILFYFHGYPGSRLEAEVLDDYGQQTGTRIIGLDRPGMGLSSFQSGRTFLDWPDDVAALADHLKVDRFSVVGISGGSPYALACARVLPERLISCGIVSGLGPLDLGTAGMNLNNRLLFFCARWFPWLLTPLIGSVARSLANEEKTQRTMAKMVQQMVKPDREALLALDAVPVLATATAEAFRQGVRGAVYEGGLYGRAWGFQLEDIAFEPLYLWHGELDRNVPVTMARTMVNKLTRCRATYYPAEGHISTLLNHRKGMLSTLFPPLS